MTKPVNRMKIRVSCTRALAAALVVYRANGDRIERFTEGKPGNKEMALDLLDGNSTLAITEQDLADAEQLRSYLAQKITIAELTGARVNDFFRDITKLTTNDEVAYFNVGQLVWAPKLADDSRKQDDVKENLNQFYFSSKYLGKEGDKIELDFVPIQVRYLQSYGCYRHVGHDSQGNLVTFLNRKNIEQPARIRARIKKCETNQYYNNAKTTNLNFVKVIG